MEAIFKKHEWTKWIKNERMAVHITKANARRRLKFMLVGQKDCTKKRQHVKTAKEHFVDDLQHLLDIKKKKKRKKTLPNSFERVSVETSE